MIKTEKVENALKRNAVAALGDGWCCWCWCTA